MLPTKRTFNSSHEDVLVSSVQSVSQSELCERLETAKSPGSG